MFSRKRTYVVLFVMPLLLCIVVAADLRALSNGTKIKGNLLGLNSTDKMEPNGVFEVQVLQRDKWQEAGSLAYDKFYREKAIDIGPYSTGEETVKLRLLQKGGGAAHIDSVLLGGRPAEEVKGLHEAAALRKLSQKDYDVVDASGETLELTFKASGTDMSLRLAARVEGMIISTTPFQFPGENLYRSMGLQRRFYKYQLNAEKGSLRIDGDLEEVVSNKPFFKSYSRTGSGHPSGFTYGWVRNDDEHLYVAMDFTPDNTMDSDKDYAKVYAKTGDGLKEFKVSVPERSWGSPGFTYTDKVTYQHKAYEFKIPLKELGVGEADEPQELQLAFAAYGTATPGNYPSAQAYDPVNNRFLVVFTKANPNTSDIYGQFIGPEGSTIGPEFVVSNASDSQWNPSVAYDSANQRFLVAWEDGRNGSDGNFDIYGQLVNADGSLFGTTSNTNFVISDTTDMQFWPSVAYDTANQRFLVAWCQYRNGSYDIYDIYGQLVNADGSLLGTASNINFVISDGDTWQYFPWVAYDTANQQFLVVWKDVRNGYSDIYAQIVNADGTPEGENFAVSETAGNQHVPTLAYDPTNQRFLVVWQDYRYESSDIFGIYGQLVNANGSLSGGNFTISNSPAYQGYPSVAYDSANQRFLVAWRDYRDEFSDIYGQFVNADGTLIESNFVISNAPDDQYEPSVAYNSNCSNFLVAYMTLETGVPDIGLTLVGEPCDTTPDPFVFVDQTGVGLNTVVESNVIEVTGINARTTMSITGGQYSINGGTYTNADGTVNNGDTITVRQTSSPDFSTTTDLTLTIGGVSDTFSVTTLAADTVPDTFSFVDQTNVPLSTVITSNPITVNGINTGIPISITGGQYSINGGTYTNAAGTVNNGDTVTVSQISSGSNSTTTDATLTIGVISDTFSVTTIPIPVYTISGKVVKLGRRQTSIAGVIAGVTINLTGATTRTTVTDAEGRYAFTGLADGAYVVKPVRRFSRPKYRAVTIKEADISELNFRSFGR